MRKLLLLCSILVSASLTSTLFASENGASITISGYINTTWYANGDDNNQNNDATVSQMEATIVKRLFPSSDITPNPYNQNKVRDVIGILQSKQADWYLWNGFLYGSSGDKYNSSWLDYASSYLLVPNSKIKNTASIETKKEAWEFWSTYRVRIYGWVEIPEVFSYSATSAKLFEIKGKVCNIDTVVPLASDGCIVNGMKKTPSWMYDSLRFCKWWAWGSYAIDLTKNKITAKVIVVESIRILDEQTEKTKTVIQKSPISNVETVSSVKEDIQDIGTELAQVAENVQLDLKTDSAIILDGTKKQMQELIRKKNKIKMTYTKSLRVANINLTRLIKLPSSEDTKKLIEQQKWQIEYIKWRIKSLSALIIQLKKSERLRK